jgi:O-glycosyl hydrolase
MMYRILTLSLLAGMVAPGIMYARSATEVQAPAKKTAAESVKGVEKITAVNGAFAAYKFTLPPGETFGAYTKIAAKFLVDREHYKSAARARALGAYTREDFSQEESLAFIDYGSGSTDKNGPYIVTNLYGSDSALEVLSGGAGPNTWFTLEFPLTGKAHTAYDPAHFPGEDASGDFYFCVGLSKSGVSGAITYYVKDVMLSNGDGSKTVLSGGSGFNKPAFVGYGDGKELLAREVPSAVGDPGAKEPPGPFVITVNTAVKHQRVIGFGGMSNAWTSPLLTEDDIDALYGPSGLGYNIFRIMLYPDRAKWDDYVGIAKKAQSYGALILATPWTPPAELKSNNSTVGGYLLPENYGKYAEHLKDFIQRLKDRGVTVDVISLQNEPDIQVNYDSCDWTPEQMADFVKQYGSDIGKLARVMPGESFQFRRNFTDPLLNDPNTADGFSVVGGHIYGGGVERYASAQEKGKEVWMTEHLLNTSGNYSYDSTWSAALMAAEEIHSCMSADFNAYIWWYLKRFYSMLGDGEYGTVVGQPLNRGYVLSHYAKYATGAVRVEASLQGGEDILVTAYESADAISMVIVNTGYSASAGTIILPVPVQSCTGVESSAQSVMQDKTLTAGTEIALTLEPKSIVSLKFAK